jgi:hypothetical protein
MKRTLRNRSKRDLDIASCSHSLPSPHDSPIVGSYLPAATAAVVVAVAAAVVPAVTAAVVIAPSVVAAAVPAVTAAAVIAPSVAAAAVIAVGLDLGGLDGLLNREGKSAANG